MRFGVLGPLAVWSADGHLVAVPEAKVRMLLAALLTDPRRAIGADRLVDELWGDAPPANPTGSLQTLVSRLRRVLTGAGGRGVVVRRGLGYALEPADDDAVDATRFTSLTARARTTRDPHERTAILTGALELWRGPAFADFADEPFARAAVARLEEQRLLAVEEQAEARIDAGDHRPLAAELGDLVARHPLRERLRAAHMRALYGAGRPSEALDGFQELRRRLDEELGLAPGPELVALQQEILQQDPALLVAPAPAATARPRTNLPAPVTSLVGRADAVDEVRELVRAGRLVTLTGPGGVGKTRLALEVAAKLGTESAGFGDGVWLVELAGHAFPTQTAQAAQTDRTDRGPGPGAPYDALAEVVAATLGVRDDAAPAPGARPRPLVDRLVETLRGQRLLLVLDNCEHVVDAAAGLARALLRGAPDVHVLATSQEPLNVAGERLWPVPPLDLPPAPSAAPDPAELRRSSAVRLFLERAAARSPGFVLTDDNARAVAAICRRLDGIPLALELASTRMRVLGAAELADRLDDRFRLLTGGRRDAPARQQTLRAMIDWSWELLTASEQLVLRRIAVHSDGCALPAAEAVCAGDGVRPAEVVDLLGRLVDRSLVLVAHEPDGTARYRLLESVSAYCLERLRDTEYDRVRRAHAEYYARFAEEADAHLRGAEQQRWLRRLDAEAANVRAALDSACADGDAELMRRLVRAMVWYWFLRGRLTEAGRQLRAAADLLDGPSHGDGTTGSAGSGIRAWRTGFALLTGAPQGPERHGVDILAAYEAVTDPHERIRAGWFLCYAATRFADRLVGQTLLDRVLTEARELGDPWVVAAGLSTRGTQAYVCGDLTASRREGRESLALFQRAGDRWGQLQATAVLGRLAEIQGEYGEAARLHRAALEIAEELGLWTDASMRWSELGRIALLTGDHDRADEYHERGRRLAVEQGDRPAEESAEIGLALAARRQGRLDVATGYLRRWLDWNRQFDAANGTALILAELGFVAELRGDADGALALHTEGLAAARATGDPRAIALATEGLAGAHALANRPGEATRLLSEASALRASVGAPLPEAERFDVSRIQSTLNPP
ncbi:BTAD domain-containing putative transcriptional regulator [Streptomyces sp. NPDC020412]|uniref:BTAD domain-containing putative transcriptional regulator n=1 Tax=Streptomyces sp. NPDC020412 TaxID=3365073 RepID=UPI0037972571